MMRSLYSGISGLRNHQTRMDVIGNNIANVNTTGFKASRVVFQDVFSQTVSSGMANTGVQGGTNPVQIGLGIRLATVDVLHTRSAFSRTDNPLDVSIAGDGFFIVGAENEDGSGYDRMYTRAGNFSIDSDGYLVSAHGLFVLGMNKDIIWGEIVPADPGSANDTPAITDPADPNFRPASPAVMGFVQGPGEPTFGRIHIGAFKPDLDAQGDPIVNNGIAQGEQVRLPDFSVAADGTISVLANNRQLPIAQLQLAVFSNPGGLQKAGNSLFIETASSGAPDDLLPGEDGAGVIEAGGLEMSNVDLASEFTDMIVTQRGFQANSRIITVSDTMLEELVNLKR